MMPISNNEFVIIVDTREQLPFTFSCIDPPPATRKKALATGDYSILGYESDIIIERKSISDLFGSCGGGRKRFEAEIRRMERFKYAAVVIEASWYEIFRNPPCMSKLSPTSILASFVAWSTRHNVHVWTAPNRAFCERLTYRLLERWWRDADSGIYHHKEQF